MNSTLNFFVSYSTGENDELAHTKKIISQVTEILHERGWNVLNPLNYKNILSIREKVHNDLFEADAVIIEATSRIPNVMYEAGFCSALGIPTIILVNRDAFEGEEKEKMKVYFDSVELNKNMPTSSKPGDIEYFEYSSKELDVVEGDGFKLGVLFDKLVENGFLAYEAVQLRRESRKILKLTANITHEYKWDEPLLAFISAWFSSLVQAFKNMEKNTFRMDPYPYREFLPFLKTHGISQVKAVSNVSTEEEKFWFNNPQPPTISPCERIFLIDWKDFLNPELFIPLADTMILHAKKYKVRFGDISILRDEQGELAKNNNSLGQNLKEGQLLLIPPDLVGGYVDEDGRTFFKVLKDERVYHRAQEYYSLLVSKTIEVTAKQNAHQIRRAWLEKEGLGKWKAEWDEHCLPMDYYKNYDKNIRFWIPYYEDFIELCSTWVKYEIERLLSRTKSNLEILEVGFGTGALTVELLNWIENLNLPNLDQVDMPIKAYWGVDNSMVMIREFCSRYKRLVKMPGRFFEKGKFWEELPSSIPESKKFDVICGSLVLHDILAENPGQRVKDFLKNCAAKLNPGGSVVFADVFWDNIPDSRIKQMANWKNAMSENGMSPRDIKDFLKYNDEMIKTVTEEQLNSAAELTGFLEPKIQTGFTGNGKYPFKVLVIRLKEKL